MKRLGYYYIYLLLVWGSFRYFVRLPEVIEELWFKPVLWLVPLFWWNLSLKENILMFGKGWKKSLFWGFLAGVVYALIMKLGKPLSINVSMDLLGIALAIAVTEEMAFSGFVAGYLEKIRKNNNANLAIVGLMTAFIRLPILLFVYQAGIKEVLGVLFMVAASGTINAWIRVKSGDVSGSIVARTMMNLATLV